MAKCAIHSIDCGKQMASKCLKRLSHGLQAVEAIKILSGVGDPMSRRLLLVDTLSARFHTVKLRAR